MVCAGFQQGTHSAPSPLLRSSFIYPFPVQCALHRSRPAPPLSRLRWRPSAVHQHAETGARGSGCTPRRWLFPEDELVLTILPARLMQRLCILSGIRTYGLRGGAKVRSSNPGSGSPFESRGFERERASHARHGRRGGICGYV